ncbi:phosphotransacetylase [Mycoplasmopsis opalescens]|uniref:phosphotransacetylase n=1 Tax=Mycoplasmopsis opalescens TaxID=114886 RepID=UPI0004A76878|nr:phosphotransacetylase [Mycoplasmopsis opalescens]
MFTSKIEEQIKNLKQKIKIAIVDGDDERAIEATKKLQKFNQLEITLITKKNLPDVDFAKVININEATELRDKFAQKYFEIREAKEKAKGKENKDTLEVCQKLMSSRPFLAMMLLKENMVDGVVGGLLYSTADILRAAFKVIGPKKGTKTISSVMIMHKENNVLFFSDISVNPKPDMPALVDIATNAAEFVKGFNIDPKLAFLSFSTNYSAKTPETELVHEATRLFNEKHNTIKAIGEVQVDAALDLKTRQSKYGSLVFDEPANTLIFPDLSAGNIGYKLVQRLGNYGAIGPIIVGSAKPVNDLSRGALVEDVYYTVLITAIQSLGEK